MQDKLNELKALMGRAFDVAAAAGVLGWDQEVNMPPGGVQARADQIGTLRGMVHEMITDDRVGRLLDELEPHAAQLDPDSDDAALIRVLRREYNKRTKIPAELIVEIYKTAGMAKEAWKAGREQQDFSIFAPHLEKMVELQIRKAEYLAPAANLYDALLDDFEPGLDYETIGAVFASLKPRLVELVQAIAAHQDAVDDSVRQRDVPAEKQIAFGQMVAEKLGYSFRHGRLDLSPHPFTSSFGHPDVRITTRVLKHDSLSCLMAVIHEAGHGMHGQSIAPSLYRTPVGQFSTLAVAESQSRFYENVIGRSRAFWQHLYPHLQAAWAPLYDDVDMETWYRAVNASRPSLIRVEADEVTYGLHIMLRFELENDMINGRVKVADLPAEWNARMEAYLGLVPPNDAVGVLQDIHWSQGGIGYFPDYLLGSIYASQLWDRLCADNPATLDEIARGEFGSVLAWTRAQVMQHGGKFTFPELTDRTVGGFSAEPYMAYLKAKYGEIYGL